MSPEARRTRTRVLLAFGAVYLIWGSTYLFIKYAIETIPPFTVGAARFVAAGAILYLFARRRGAPRPTASELRMGALTGVLMLGLGNGAVVWAELTVPSGIVALIVSTVPIWIVLFDWMRPRGVRPRAPVFVGLALGLVGMAILIGPRAVVGEGNVNELGALALFVGSLGWALGSVLTRTHGGVRSPLVFSSIQMFAASGAMFLAALAFREFSGFSFAQVSLKSALSWVYLAIAGSIIGYSAYVYLLGVVTAAKAATYAYVNPVIAVLLGWAFANEPIGMRTVVAAAVILAGVAIITSMQTSTVHVTGEHPIPDSTRAKAA